MNIFVPQKFIGSGAIRRCGFVGGEFSLIGENVSLCGQTLRFLRLRNHPMSQEDVGVSAPAICLPVGCQGPSPEDNGLKL